MSELGRTLHAWRDRVTPADVGLPSGGKRRAPGLRREELALLAGLSVDYIVRLEQGRSESPSAQVLTALARALRLSDAERNHLFALAGEVEPSPGRISSYIPPGVQRIVDQLDGAPLCVCDAAWTIISWNPLFAAMIGDPSQLQGRWRNIAYRHFLAIGDRIAQTPDQQRNFRDAMVTDLRAAQVRYPHDPELAALIDELRGVDEFARLWDRPVVGFHRSERKTVRHPEVGPFDIDCDILAVPGSDLRMVVYTAAPNTEAAEKLRLLSVIGLQTLT
ncbi:helix-turn-helix transcriptional regulator [Kribbella shirazensis]|uniref:Transcriptional regulator with XRE-family HTH domain n=1 Tax=Kribbella shirazensis TaxID=1105143 RepID=A0A7X5V7H5_9ACTN|nr:helix-turn-helix transcriptional regulator [Kribbella shirazensis]NIK56055.1 transcriptional regulator with XRE-family HTH domain [Kribbella shirazensis]